FLRETGFDFFENDGPYPGDVCASTTHPGHKNLDDSQWRQMELQKGLYHWCNENGVYVNAPDWYFLDGTNKIAIGYREVNFSLSREQQKILNRQNIYDGTWEKTPSMGWGFVPLTRYQGGGPEAVLEPLNEHLTDYEQLMVQYYGAGVQACYRGPRLYDTEETRRMVARTLDWYKCYRDILNSDIIHLRRADGRDWDGILHVNPALPTKGFLLLFNPLKEPITRRLYIPLYYTGLQNKAVFYNDNEKRSLRLNRQFEATLDVTIPAGSWVWYAIR
ncbi:MAG TPA: alpha-galactosidase, partial [Saprospiraceae bacterium]|nr:alpha-galactosidase [Saprospiraceae bacterium]